MPIFFPHRSRSELIAALIAPSDAQDVSANVIAHALRGNVLWSVVEIKTKEPASRPAECSTRSGRYICCDLLEHRDNAWGYKRMDEAMHPYYYTCPLSYLDMAPEASPSWRTAVRAFHSRRRIPATSSASAT